MNKARKNANLDIKTVLGFGDEWSRFTQIDLDDEIAFKVFCDYFSLFDWDLLPVNSMGMDIGCGSGRWAKIVAAKVGHLVLLDASEVAIKVAKKNLNSIENVSYVRASVGELPVRDRCLDFAYSLGVLHHVPVTEDAIKSIALKLKAGAPLLIYIYYAFDNRGYFYQKLWRLSDLTRRVISRLPNKQRYIVSQIIALLIYWPLARLALILDTIKLLPNSWPLMYYRDKSFYVMRTDALDRFGTPLEHRFSRQQIELMLINSGFENIKFSNRAPFWCATATKS